MFKLGTGKSLYNNKLSMRAIRSSIANRIVSPLLAQKRKIAVTTRVSRFRKMSSLAAAARTTRTATGRCLCGETEYLVDLGERAPSQLMACHCSQCRRATGGLWTAFGAFARESVRFTRSNKFKAYKVVGLNTYYAAGDSAGGGAAGGSDPDSGKESTGSTKPGIEFFEKSGADMADYMCTNLVEADLKTENQKEEVSLAKRGFCSGCGAFVLMDYGELETFYLTLGLLSEDPVFQNYTERQNPMDLVRGSERLYGGRGDVQGCPEATSSTAVCRWKSTDVFYESRCKLQDIFVSPAWPHVGKFGYYVVDSANKDCNGKTWREYPHLCEHADLHCE